MSKPEPKPCPFCGIQPELCQLRSGPAVMHRDNACLVTVTGGMSKIRLFSLEWWNKRVTPKRKRSAAVTPARKPSHE